MSSPSARYSDGISLLVNKQFHKHRVLVYFQDEYQPWPLASNLFHDLIANLEKMSFEMLQE